MLFLYAGVFKESFSQNIDLAILAFAILIIIIVVDLIKKPSVARSITVPSIFFLVLIALTLVSFSINPFGDAQSKLLKLLLLTVPAVVIPFFIFKSKGDFLNFAKSLIILSSILALISLPQALSGQNMFVGFNERNYQGLSRVLGAGFLASLILFILSEKRNKIIIVPIILVVGTMLFYAGSRMPIIAVAISLLLPLTKLITVKKGDVQLNKKYLKVATVYTVLFFSAVTFIGRGLFDTIAIRFQQLLDMGSSSNVGRTERYSLAWDLFSDNPLMGIGFGGFGDYYRSESGNYAHNLFLEMASELGILGILWTVAYFTYLSIKSIKSFNYSNILATLYVVLFSYMILNAMVSGDINDNRVMFSIGSIICILNVKSVVGLKKDEIDLARVAEKGGTGDGIQKTVRNY